MTSPSSSPATDNGGIRTKTSVLVIYTGGTIGMVADPENDYALAPSVSYIRNELDNIAKYENQEFPMVNVVEFEQLIDSSDMNVTFWAKIAKAIGDNYYEYDGFVVIMGTDTMAYTASAISFMLKNLGKPVVFTGAMIPLYKGESDARRNLLISIEVAASSNIPEVCIFFHDRLLRGNRAKKIKSNALDAFDSPNAPPLATFGTSLVVNETHILPHPRKHLKVVSNLDPSVLVVRLIPGFSDKALECLIGSDIGLRALVLELYGVGNLPMRKESLLRCLKAGIDRGLIIVVCSQCVYGEVNLKAYQVGKVLKDMGAIAAEDMTIECVSTKLAFLFGQESDNEVVKQLMKKNLRGEVTEN